MLEASQRDIQYFRRSYQPLPYWNVSVSDQRFISPLGLGLQRFHFFKTSKVIVFGHCSYHQYGLSMCLRPHDHHYDGKGGSDEKIEALQRDIQSFCCSCSPEPYCKVNVSPQHFVHQSDFRFKLRPCFLKTRSNGCPR